MPKKNTTRLKQPWTKKEIDILLEKYGKVPHEQLAKKLNRSVASIKQKYKNVTGTTKISFANDGFSTVELAKILSVNKTTVQRMIKKGLSSKKVPIHSTNANNKIQFHYIIQTEDFWDFLKEHRSSIQIASRAIPRGILLPEPDWFIEDVANNVVYGVRPWTNEELYRLEKLYYKDQKTIAEIALELNRTYASVHLKIRQLTKKKISSVLVPK